MKRAALVAVGLAVLWVVVHRPEPQPPAGNPAQIASKVVVPPFQKGDKVRCHGAGTGWDGRGGVIVRTDVNPEGCHLVDVAGTEFVIPPYYLTPLPPEW